MFTALLDTCVLWPSLQRDFLLSLAVEGIYRPVWSSVILEELEYEEKAKWIRRGEADGEATGRALHLIKQMRQSFDDAEVEGWEGLEGTYDLPDPNDEHLVAAAVVANAGAIVTHNTKDLPRNKMPAGLQVLTPPEFTMNTVSLDPVHRNPAPAPRHISRPRHVSRRSLTGRWLCRRLVGQVDPVVEHDAVCRKHDVSSDLDHLRSGVRLSGDREDGYAAWDAKGVSLIADRHPRPDLFPDTGDHDSKAVKLGGVAAGPRFPVGIRHGRTSHHLQQQAGRRHLLGYALGAKDELSFQQHGSRRNVEQFRRGGVRGDLPEGLVQTVVTPTDVVVGRERRGGRQVAAELGKFLAVPVRT